MRVALSELDLRWIGGEYSHAFLGQPILANRAGKYVSVDPNSPSDVIGQFQNFDPHTMNIDKLVSGAKDASRRWNAMGIETRAKLIERTADIMESRIMLISVAMVREIGKSFIEAYADACEAIDFMRWNAHLARLIYDRALPPIPSSAGNYNARIMIPHGAYLSLNPFNFEVAIGTDQIAKPLLMGNTVISSPSDKSSLCGRLVYECFQDAFRQLGIENDGILNWAPGPGGDIADPILRHSDLAGLCFTGSSDVLDYIRRTHGFTKRSNGGNLVISSAETSGVNAMYIHHDADLDSAATGIAAAACGLSGQKCSALSTLIVHESVYQELMPKVYSAVDNLSFGFTREGAYLGGVISQAARKKIERTHQEFLHVTAVPVLLYTQKK